MAWPGLQTLSTTLPGSVKIFKYTTKILNVFFNNLTARLELLLLGEEKVMNSILKNVF
jgi:hypothetical protein